MITVLVVDDQTLQRVGFRMLLEAEPDLTVVGEATTGAAAIHMTTALRPDVVLIGVRAPGPDAVETIRGIAGLGGLSRAPVSVRAGRCPPRLLVLTDADLDTFVYSALRAGAGGILPADVRPDDLTRAIRAVAAGDAVISPRLTREFIEILRKHLPVETPAWDLQLATLTERERDVLGAVASGWSNAEIAEQLSIATTTVKAHVSRILAKIGARARVQAVVFAYESGLVRPPLKLVV